MNRYEIRCTPEQTRKAIELGAPIPTAEQMLGWLEEQGLHINFDTTSEEDINNCLIIKWEYFIYNKYHDIINDQYYEYPTRKKAILAAIDAALEYLSNTTK